MLTGWRAQHEWLAASSQNAQQQTIRDFCKARSDACQIRKRGGRRGDPQFRSKRLWHRSVNYTRNGFRLRDGRLVLAGGVVLRPVWSRELPSTPSSVRVSRDALGRWSASFVVEREVAPLPTTGLDVGIDWGLKAVATTTSGPAFDLAHVDHHARSQRGLARYQRQMARRKAAPGQPASAGYREAKRQAARAHAKIAEQRSDEARKWAIAVVRAHDRIAVEDFKPQFV